jgi:Ca2+ transporting ATPase
MQDLKVIARATPEDKILLTVGLQAINGNKVAIIGESINDIPAFKQADVSFAMGSGSSIARNNASIVLATDEFESVMRSVMWGRNIYLNMQRFLTFQMTCSFACLITIVIGYCFLFESPLNAVQLIWINLIMDIFGALALSATRPTT